MQRRALLKTLGLVSANQLVSGNLHAAAAPSGQDQSPDIFFNQLGYRPNAAKAATIRGAAPGQTAFRVRSAVDNNTVFEGRLSASSTDAASGDLVQQAVFSSLTQPGSYRLEVGGQGSGAFTLDDRIYAETLRTVMRGFTGQRCGCAVDLGQGYRHPPCHLDGAYNSTSGRSGPLPNRGGWHDAGDYGRYIVNSAITCGTLLWAWELFPEVLRSLDLGIVRQHGNLPQYLEEILWNLTWMLQLQEPDGGVFHKQTSDHFCAFIMPQDDHLVSNVIGLGRAPYKTTAASAGFSAVMAIAARVYSVFDKRLAAQFLDAARRAYTWAAENPSVPFKNPPGITTGEYGDPHLEDELLWAAAELFRTTAGPSYEQAFLHAIPVNLRLDAPSWSSVGSLACWTYALTPKADPKTQDSIRQATQAVAQVLIARSHTNGYANTLAPENYTWGSNGTAANQSLLLVVAHHLQANSEASAVALANLHYLLGRNCFGVSWVTQVGTRPFMHPHHRPSAADNLVAPWPGLLSGGPNRHGGDPVADALPKAPPMRMWVDDQRAYSLNEIAINWNAPLVFLLAFANTSASLG